MSLRVTIDVGYRPELDADELLAIVKNGLGMRYDVHGSGRFQVWDVMVEESPEIGAAIQILQGRIRKRTRLRVYGLAPSIALRGVTPVGLKLQGQRSRSLVQEVVRFLEHSEELSAPSAGDVARA